MGQPIHWPAAPHGIAQVEQLGRMRVRLVYRTRTGRWRHPLVRVESIDFTTPPLPMHNPLGRGCLARSKCYQVEIPVYPRLTGA